MAAADASSLSHMMPVYRSSHSLILRDHVRTVSCKNIVLIVRLASYVWNVRLPTNLPSCEKCIFAWAWINAIGNREYYMNCADIKIIGGPGSKISGSPLHIANLEGYPVEQPLAAYGTPESSAFNYKSIQVV